MHQVSGQVTFPTLTILTLQQSDDHAAAMARKNDEYQNALSDLTAAHRTAEDGRLEALQQLESRVYELDDQKASLNSAIERLSHLQAEHQRAEVERDALRDALRRFQLSVNRVVGAGRPPLADTEEPIVPVDDPIRAPSFPSAADDATSAHDLDSTLSSLVSRIERIQRDREEFRAELDRLKKRANESHTTFNKRETHYRTIEENLTDVEEGKTTQLHSNY